MHYGASLGQNRPNGYFFDTKNGDRVRSLSIITIFVHVSIEFDHFRDFDQFHILSLTLAPNGWRYESFALVPAVSKRGTTVPTDELLK